MSCVIVEPAGALPLIRIGLVLTVTPSRGKVITSPTTGVEVGSGLGLGDGVMGVVLVGVGVGVGGEVGLGGGARVGVGVGANVGVGGSVGDGLGVAVGTGEGVGVSCTKTGSDEMADALGEGEGDAALATSVDRPPKTLTTISSAITVSPATRPPSSQSRRGGVDCKRRARALCETPLCCWPAWGGGGCGAPLAMGTAA